MVKNIDVSMKMTAHHVVRRESAVAVPRETESRLATHAAEGGSDIRTFAVLQQNHNDQDGAYHHVNKRY